MQNQTQQYEGNGIVYCEGSLSTDHGRLAHNLILHGRRFRIQAIVDSTSEGKDTGSILGHPGIKVPIYRSIEQAIRRTNNGRDQATHLIIGMLPHSSRFATRMHSQVMAALEMGLHINYGMYESLAKDRDIAALAKARGLLVEGVVSNSRRSLHTFTNRVGQVKSFKIAVLGTDDAVGEKTTTWLLAAALEQCGVATQVVGTSYPMWLQGAQYFARLERIPKRYVTGEIEHAVCRAWKETRADALIIEGLGNPLHPIEPSGFEILSASAPDVVILQHAPGRSFYKNAVRYRQHSLERQIETLELLFNVPVTAVVVNNENISKNQLPITCAGITDALGIPAIDVLEDKASRLSDLVLSRMQQD